MSVKYKKGKESLRLGISLNAIQQLVLKVRHQIRWATGQVKCNQCGKEAQGSVHLPLNSSTIHLHLYLQLYISLIYYTLLIRLIYIETDVSEESSIQFQGILSWVDLFDLRFYSNNPAGWNWWDRQNCLVYTWIEGDHSPNTARGSGDDEGILLWNNLPTPFISSDFVRWLF